MTLLICCDKPVVLAINPSQLKIDGYANINKHCVVWNKINPPIIPIYEVIPYYFDKSDYILNKIIF